VIPFQVSGQSLATNSRKLPQAAGLGGAAGAGPSAARATLAMALMTSKARTDFFTFVLLTVRSPCCLLVLVDKRYIR